MITAEKTFSRIGERKHGGLHYVPVVILIVVDGVASVTGRIGTEKNMPPAEGIVQTIAKRCPRWRKEEWEELQTIARLQGSNDPAAIETLFQIFGVPVPLENVAA